jgi:hypothetical protein
MERWLRQQSPCAPALRLVAGRHPRLGARGRGPAAEGRRCGSAPSVRRAQRETERVVARAGVVRSRAHPLRPPPPAAAAEGWARGVGGHQGGAEVAPGPVQRPVGREWTCQAWVDAGLPGAAAPAQRCSAVARARRREAPPVRHRCHGAAAGRRWSLGAGVKRRQSHHPPPRVRFAPARRSCRGEPTPPPPWAESREPERGHQGRARALHCCDVSRWAVRERVRVRRRWPR